ncbi:MAG TPA: hypothetical protein VHC69_30220 [Polyangiaceae bacterium]|nr:hypothetical protein [Polyangiaceae bacterium]
MAKVNTLGMLLRVAALLSGSLLVMCDNADCEKLRDDLYADRLRWQACEEDSDCEIIGGNTADCTGIFSCNLAVNAHSVKDAERRIASLPEESVDCHKCNSPNCPDGEIALCDSVYKRCIIVKDVTDGRATSDYTPNTGGVPATGGTDSTGAAGLGADSGAGGTGGFGGTDLGQGLFPAL